MADLRQRVAEAKEQECALEAEGKAAKEAFDQWLLETDTAIEEACQSAEERRARLKNLEASVKQSRVSLLLSV